MYPGRLFVFAVAGVLAGFGLPGVARGADTFETFAPGASDLEFYAGFDGIGPSDSERTVYSDMVLGYGLVDRLSAFLSVGFLSNEYFCDAEAHMHTVLFGTPLDTDHLDLDLAISFYLGGPGLTALTAAPGFELNVDLRPDQALWGLYLRTELFVSGQAEPQEEEASPDYHLHLHLAPVFGTYWTVAPGHQLLLEYDMLFGLKTPSDEDTVSVGGVALGYNVMIHQNVELINQVSVDLSVGAVGIMTGIIVTMQ